MQPAPVLCLKRVLRCKHVAGGLLLPGAPSPRAPPAVSLAPAPPAPQGAPGPPRPPGRQLALTPSFPAGHPPTIDFWLTFPPSPFLQLPCFCQRPRVIPVTRPRGQLGRLCAPVLTCRPRRTPTGLSSLCFLPTSPASACLAVAITAYLVFCLQLTPSWLPVWFCPESRSDLGSSPSPPPISEARNAQDWGAGLKGVVQLAWSVNPARCRQAPGRPCLPRKSVL